MNLHPKSLMRHLNRADRPHSDHITLKLPEGKCLRVVGLALVMLLSNLLMGTGLGYAQSPSPQNFSIESLETSDFPTSTFSFHHPAVGATLSPDQVTIREDYQDIQPDQLTAVYEGIHFAVVVNPTFELGYADERGITRLNQAVSTLGLLEPSIQNDAQNHFSLFINPDLTVEELPNFRVLMDTLKGYDQNMRAMTSSLDSLEQAISYLSGLENEQEKTILFITPSMYYQVLDRFDQIAAQAQEHHIVLQVWMVADGAYSTSVNGLRVAATVQPTGGSLFVYSGSMNFPDPSNLIQGKGYSYTASYTSAIRSSGTHSLAVLLTLPDGTTIESDEFRFDLEVEPIQLEFINLPENLTITENANATLAPDELPLEIALSFPDHHPREIISVELWANGSQVQVNTQPPYGSFVLPFSEIMGASQLEIEARVTDSFGLEGTSVVEIIPVNWDRSEIIRASRALLWSRVLLGVCIGALVVILLLVRPWRNHKKSPKTEKQAPTRIIDQTQPAAPEFLATFSYMESSISPSPKKPYAITQEITLIGRDPSLSQWVMDDQSLEPLHAELRILPSGQARLTDFNTTAGTWVNFEKVSTRGVELKKGDLVKLGNQLFSFNPRLK